MEKSKVTTAIIQQVYDNHFAEDYNKFYAGDTTVKLNIEDREFNYVVIVTVERQPYMLPELYNFVDCPNVKRYIFPVMYRVKHWDGEDIVEELTVSSEGAMLVSANDINDELRASIISAAAQAIKALKKHKGAYNVFYFRK